MLAFALVAALPALVSAIALPKRTGCPTTSATMNLPAGQSTLVAPSGAPSFIGLGVGVQNYTCGAAGTYTNVGAVAELFDISCLVGSSSFATIQTEAYNVWDKLPSSITTLEIANFARLVPPFDKYAVLGQHYFVTSPTNASTTSPKWDFTSDRFKGNANAFVIGAKTGDLPSPAGSADIDWLSLKNVEGELATSIFRVDTVAGQPPASCTPGSAEISVKYTSKYYLYGSEL